MKQYHRLMTALIFVLIPITALSPAAHADENNQPVVLEVTIAASDETQEFSLYDLREIGVETIVTSTIWTDGIHEFSGVPLRALMWHLGIEDGNIKAIALNNYAVSFPTTDILEPGPIVAFEIDGGPIPRREKGPLWIVYPFDAAPEYRTETIYSRSIWQLNRMLITP